MRAHILPPEAPVIPTQTDFTYDFTYYDFDKKVFQDISPENTVRLLQLLRQHFDVAAITPIVPWLVIECRDSTPPEGTRPFTVAGLVAVFTLVDEPFPFGVDFIGEYGNGDELNLSTAIAGDLREHDIPKIATHNELHGLLPVAEYISSYPTQVLVECLEMSEESFQLFLDKAPSHFGELVAGYVNGTVIRESHSRSKPPAPRTVDGNTTILITYSPSMAGRCGLGCSLRILAQRSMECV
jgi:hypothetical protein